MFARFASIGAALALLLVTAGPTAAEAAGDPAKKGTRPACCAAHPASHAKCCASGTKAACCHGDKAAKSSAAAVCPITGKSLKQCCGKKASQNPPCCQKGCKQTGKVVH